MTDKIIDKVRKMMNLANDAGATEGERDNALRMAHALLAKHNLDMSQVDLTGAQPSEKRVDENLKVRSKMWMAQVANAIAGLFFCKMYMTRHHDGIELTYIGRVSNVTTAKELTNYVIESVRREGAKGAKGDSAWHLSFNKGAAARIAERCRALREEAERASQGLSTGTALVLASVYRTELTANEDYLKNMGVKLKSSGAGRRSRINDDAYGAGREYGGKVSLNRQVGGNNSQRLN